MDLRIPPAAEDWDNLLRNLNWEEQCPDRDKPDKWDMQADNTGSAAVAAVAAAADTGAGLG